MMGRRRQNACGWFTKKMPKYYGLRNQLFTPVHRRILFAFDTAGVRFQSNFEGRKTG
jgi:hypothetical protein